MKLTTTVLKHESADYLVKVANTALTSAWWIAARAAALEALFHSHEFAGWGNDQRRAAVDALTCARTPEPVRGWALVIMSYTHDESAEDRRPRRTNPNLI